MSILGSLGAIGSIGSAVGSAVGGATQSSAAKKAAQLEAQNQQQAENFINNQWNTEQTNEAPYIGAGQNAISSLNNLMSVPGQGLLQPWTQQFQAPSLAQAEQMPGYQFALQQGEQALQNSAAARGGLLGSGTAKNLNNYAQSAAEGNYQNVYNNALQQYQQSYNQFQQNQANQYNRLSGVAGIGQNAVGQQGQIGTALSGQFGNVALQGGAQQGRQMNNAAAAQAAGIVGGTNAINGGLTNLGDLMALQNYGGSSTGGYAGALSSLPVPGSGNPALSTQNSNIGNVLQNPNGPFYNSSSY